MQFCATCGAVFHQPPHNIQPYKRGPRGDVCSVTCFVVETQRFGFASEASAVEPRPEQQASAPEGATVFPGPKPSAPEARQGPVSQEASAPAEGATGLVRAPEGATTATASVKVQPQHSIVRVLPDLPGEFHAWVTERVESANITHAPDDSVVISFADATTPAVTVGDLRDWLARLPPNLHTAKSAQLVDSDRDALLKRADRIAEEAKEIVREALRVRDENALRLKNLGEAYEQAWMRRKEQEEMKKRIDDVYAERNTVVGALVKLAQRQGYRVGYAFDEGMDASESMDASEREEWPVLFIDLPTGQVSWHVPRSQLPSGILRYAGKYDGHTTEEKYARLAQFAEEL